MANLLSKARGLLGKAKANEPTPFSIRCYCGATTTGDRDDQASRRSCSRCGATLFVYPTSPLPTPEAAKIRAAKKQSASSESKSTSGKATDFPTPAPVKKKPRKPISQVLKERLARLVPPRHWFSRKRLITAGVVLFIVASVGWNVRSRHLADLRDNVGPRGQKGLQDLTEGRFAEAAENLGYAVRAMDTLKEETSEGAVIRQAYREIEIERRLLEGSMDEALSEFDARAVNRVVKDRTIVVDTILVRDPEQGWESDFVAFHGEQAVRLDLAGVTLFDTVLGEGKGRVIFGARIKEFAEIDGGEARLRIAPESVTLMTHSRLYNALALSRAENAETIRAKQAKLVDPRR